MDNYPYVDKFPLKTNPQNLKFPFEKTTNHTTIVAARNKARQFASNLPPNPKIRLVSIQVNKGTSQRAQNK